MINIDLVTVVNDPDLYEKCFVNNKNVNQHNLIMYDNTTDNIPVTKRFNDYINNKMKDDTWIVFCHQDFEIHESIEPKLGNLDKNCIYGPIGAQTINQFVFFLRMYGIKIKKCRIGFTKKMRLKGQIYVEENGKHKLAGYKAKYLELVDTLDCCCFIIHSSLIKNINYKFDENLDWHLYSEDLSSYAKINHDIKTKIINFKASHYSPGNFDENYYLSLEYLRKKYNNNSFDSAVFDGPYMKFKEKL